MLVDHSEGLGTDYREVETAVLRLSFDYGGVRVAASDPRDLVELGEGRAPRRRDRTGEARARQVLESFGPVELGALDTYASFTGPEPDYVVDVTEDIDALCAFSAQAVPRLRALGWQVEISETYQCRVVSEATWYADLQEPTDDDGSWFELELGVDVDGRKVDLLPLLLELLQQSRGAGLGSLLRRAKRWTAVPVGDRRYLAVPAERLQAILRVVRELYEVEGDGSGRLRIPELVPSYLDELDEALGDASLELRGEVDLSGRRARLLPAAELPRVEPPAELQATLRPYQQEGLDWLQNLRAHGVGGILADDMGLGKTLQTIAHLLTEKVAGRLRQPALVVAPTSLVGNWRRELARFAPSLQVLVLHGPRRRERFGGIIHADVVITTYPLVLRDIDVLSRHRFYLQVLDEAHTVKNVRSQIHQAVKAVDAELRLCITGTPLENNLDELWALFDLMMPGFLGSAERFRAAFRTPIERMGNEERLETLRKRVSPFILRRMKDAVAQDLPAKTEIVRTVELEGGQRDLYESIRLAAHAAVRRVVKKKGIAASTIDILGALMKLRQVCCDPRLVPVPSARAVEQTAKYDALMEMLEQMLPMGRRVLVFSQFTSMLGLIAQGLRQRGVRYVCLTGSTTDRQAMVDAFQQGRAEVFLISLKAGGAGLNLTRADTVIHFDPWWNPAAQAQATDRAYRIGQKRPVFVYNLIVAGSVEERMLALQRRKQSLADSILSAGDPNLELTLDDVDGLFAPLSSDRDDDA
ncbi:MAG: DEAD/DEAH box helicase [Myxococcales bacterium]|nr:DEAD/DEAH box helicase [Myxococcales bacterium]